VERRGQIMIMAVVMVLILAAVCALTVDVGLIFCMRARLQNGADAASLAAVLELIQQRNDGASEEEARAEATAEAEAIAQANSPGAGVEVKFGLVDEDGRFIEQDTCVEASAVQVVLRRDETADAGPVGLFFAPLFGMAEQDVRAEAVAGRSNSIMRIHKGMRPFAIYEGDIVPPGQIITVYDQELVAPGCFGFIDFNGGSHGVPELREWILNGSDTPFTIDPETGYTIVSGMTGFRAALKTVTEELIVEDASDQTCGKDIIVCVYDQVGGEGSNAYFRVVSFLSVTLVEAHFTGQEKYIKARVNDMTTIQDADVGNVGQSQNVCAVQIVM